MGKIDALANSASLLAQSKEWAEGTPERPEQAPMLVDDVWSLRLMRSAAKIAISRVRSRQSDMADFDDALSGVMLAVAQNPTIEFWDAVYAGQNEALAQRQSRTQMYGARQHGGRPQSEGYAQSGRNFIIFWDHEFNRPRFTHPEAVDERLTLNAVWLHLDPDDRDILAFIAFDHEPGWAERLCDHLGLSRTSFSTAHKKVRAARRHAQELWFDGETPHIIADAPRRPRSTHCRAGHDLTDPANVREVRTKTGSKTIRCRVCQTLSDKARYQQQKKAAA